MKQNQNRSKSKSAGKNLRKRRTETPKGPKNWAEYKIITRGIIILLTIANSLKATYYNIVSHSATKIVPINLLSTEILTPRTDHNFFISLWFKTPSHTAVNEGSWTIRKIDSSANQAEYILNPVDNSVPYTSCELLNKDTWAFILYIYDINELSPGVKKLDFSTYHRILEEVADCTLPGCTGLCHQTISGLTLPSTVLASTNIDLSSLGFEIRNLKSGMVNMTPQMHIDSADVFLFGKTAFHEEFDFLNFQQLSDIEFSVNRASAPFMSNEDFWLRREPDGVRLAKENRIRYTKAYKMYQSSHPGGAGTIQTMGRTFVVRVSLNQINNEITGGEAKIFFAMTGAYNDASKMPELIFHIKKQDIGSDYNIFSTIRHSDGSGGYLITTATKVVSSLKLRNKKVDLVISYKFLPIGKADGATDPSVASFVFVRAHVRGSPSVFFQRYAGHSLSQSATPSDLSASTIENYEETLSAAYAYITNPVLDSLRVHLKSFKVIDGGYSNMGREGLKDKSAIHRAFFLDFCLLELEGKCYECFHNYYLDGGVCKKCEVGSCYSCQSAAVCDSCACETGSGCPTTHTGGSFDANKCLYGGCQDGSPLSFVKSSDQLLTKRCDWCGRIVSAQNYVGSTCGFGSAGPVFKDSATNFQFDCYKPNCKKILKSQNFNFFRFFYFF